MGVSGTRFWKQKELGKGSKLERDQGLWLWRQGGDTLRLEESKVLTTPGTHHLDLAFVVYVEKVPADTVTGSGLELH